MEYPIDNNFTYHKPRSEDLPKFVEIREAAKSLAKLLGELCPEGRELALARTKLEEATFWANAGIARQGELR